MISDQGSVIGISDRDQADRLEDERKNKIYFCVKRQPLKVLRDGVLRGEGKPGGATPGKKKEKKEKKRHDGRRFAQRSNLNIGILTPDHPSPTLDFGKSLPKRKKDDCRRRRERSAPCFFCFSEEKRHFAYVMAILVETIYGK